LTFKKPLFPIEKIMCCKWVDTKSVIHFTEKNNRRDGRGTACKYVRAMAFASCGAVGGFLF
jgi:hypothetical protein